MDIGAKDGSPNVKKHPTAATAAVPSTKTLPPSNLMPEGPAPPPIMESKQNETLPPMEGPVPPPLPAAKPPPTFTPSFTTLPATPPSQKQPQIVNTTTSTSTSGLPIISTDMLSPLRSPIPMRPELPIHEMKADVADGLPSVEDVLDNNIHNSISTSKTPTEEEPNEESVDMEMSVSPAEGEENEGKVEETVKKVE